MNTSARQYEQPVDNGSKSLLCVPPHGLVVCILLLHLSTVVGQLCTNAALIDEPRHLIAGARHLQYGRYDIYRVNPPLPRMIAALSLACSSTKVDWSSHTSNTDIASETLVALNYIREHGRHSRPVIIGARGLCVPFTLLGAVICYSWAHALYGELGALLSLCCWCFFPLVQGGASVILPDLPAASMTILACWCYWNWLREATMWNLLGSTFSLGGALLCKTTLILLPPLYLAAFLLGTLLNERRNHKCASTCRGLFIILVGGISLLNAGYLFEGTFTQLKEYRFKSALLTDSGVAHGPQRNLQNRFQGTLIGELPLPFPRPYIEGIDHLKQEYEMGMDSYLRGHWKPRGWWYYNLYGLLVKTPVPMLIMTAVAACAFTVSLVWGGSGVCLNDTRVLFVFPLLFFVFHSLQTGLSHHLRYLLPVVPFWCICVARGASVFERTSVGRSTLTSLLLWLMAEGTLTGIHQIGYYNELVGGPVNGHMHLLESNTDWGQDLYNLEDWLRETIDGETVLVDYYGFASPSDYGLRLGQNVHIENSSNDKCKYLAAKEEDFWLCVSVGKLHTTRHYAYLLDRPPQFRAGFSILIYKVNSVEMKHALHIAEDIARGRLW